MCVSLKKRGGEGASSRTVKKEVGSILERKLVDSDCSLFIVKGRVGDEKVSPESERDSACLKPPDPFIGLALAIRTRLVNLVTKSVITDNKGSMSPGKVTNITVIIVMVRGSDQMLRPDQALDGLKHGPLTLKCTLFHSGLGQKEHGGMSAGGIIMQGLCCAADGKALVTAVFPGNIGTVQDDGQRPLRHGGGATDKVQAVCDRMVLAVGAGWRGLRRSRRGIGRGQGVGGGVGDPRREGGAADSGDE